jgi:hypothetical protein
LATCPASCMTLLIVYFLAPFFDIIDRVPATLFIV